MVSFFKEQTHCWHYNWYTLNVLSTHLTKDRELSELQKEELKLKIEKLKGELEDEKQPSINLEDSLEVANTNIKIIKHRSNFYENLNNYEKVEKLSTETALKIRLNFWEKQLKQSS